MADVDWWECVDEDIPGLMPEKMMIERGWEYLRILCLYRPRERNTIKAIEKNLCNGFLMGEDRKAVWQW